MLQSTKMNEISDGQLYYALLWLFIIGTYIPVNEIPNPQCS